MLNKEICIRPSFQLRRFSPLLRRPFLSFKTFSTVAAFSVSLCEIRFPSLQLYNCMIGSLGRRGDWVKVFCTRVFLRLNWQNLKSCIQTKPFASARAKSWTKPITQVGAGGGGANFRVCLAHIKHTFHRRPHTIRLWGLWGLYFWVAPNSFFIGKDRARPDLRRLKNRLLICIKDRV